MAGLDPSVPNPTEITLHQTSRVLELRFSDGSHFHLPCEYLRVYSPSADVRGHTPDQAVLQTGKRNVSITAIEPVGNYAIQPTFSDGHSSGLYSWDVLYTLGRDQEQLWADYLKQLEAAGASRDIDLTLKAPKAGGGGSCSKH